MTLRKLLNKYRYKNIFNILHKNYLTKKRKEKVQNADLGFYSAWNELISLEVPEVINLVEALHISEVVDDLEPDSLPFIDITLRDRDTDELFSLDFCSWDKLIDLEIENATTLKDDEILAEILWEITFWGFSQDKILKQRKELERETKEAWDEVEKDLGNLYNSEGDE